MSIIDLWEVRKVKLYRESCFIPSLSLSPRLGICGIGLWLEGQRRGKFGMFSHLGTVRCKLFITDDLLHVCSC